METIVLDDSGDDEAGVRESEDDFRVVPSRPAVPEVKDRDDGDGEGNGEGPDAPSKKDGGSSKKEEDGDTDKADKDADGGGEDDDRERESSLRDDEESASGEDGLFVSSARRVPAHAARVAVRVTEPAGEGGDAEALAGGAHGAGRARAAVDGAEGEEGGAPG